MQIYYSGDIFILHTKYYTLQHQEQSAILCQML
jgi:hypothetical protein